MLDEATAAAEAMTLAKRSVKSKSNVFIVAGDCHPQTIEVIQTRAKPLGIEVKVSSLVQHRAAAHGRGRLLRRAGAVPGHQRHASTTCGRWRGRRMRRRRRPVRGRRPAGADAAHAARRMGRRHRARHHAALRHADGQRRPARRLPGLPRRIQALAARPPGRRERGQRTATRPTAWRCRRASSTSAAKKPPPTSAPRRCCRPWWPACTPCTTARKA